MEKVYSHLSYNNLGLLNFIKEKKRLIKMYNSFEILIVVYCTCFIIF